MRTDILSCFASKMINSGHSREDTKKILVNGVTKYLLLVACSEKPENDKRHKPLYVGKEYRASDRQLKKFMAKMTWFRKKRECEEEGIGSESNCKEEVENSNAVAGERGKRDPTWRDGLGKSWELDSVQQRNVGNLNYSSLLQVPSTKGARLLRVLIRQESTIARISGYNVKMCKKSGNPFARLFQRVYTPKVCHWSDCPTCKNTPTNK